MKITTRIILFAFGMTVGTTFGSGEQERFLDCSTAVSRDEVAAVVSAILECKKSEVTQKEIDYVMPYLDNIRIITHKSILKSKFMKEFCEAVIRECGENPLDLINDLMSMPYHDICEVMEGWGEYQVTKAATKGNKLSPEKISNFKNTLKRLVQHTPGRELFSFIFIFDRFHYPIDFKEASREECSSFTLTSEAVIELHFSAPLYGLLHEIYHEFNHYLHIILGVHMANRKAGDYSIPFARNFLGYPDYSRYDTDPKINEKLRKVTGIRDKSVKFSNLLSAFDISFNQWGNLEELFNVTGFAVIESTIFINHFCDFRMFDKCTLWGHMCPKESEENPWYIEKGSRTPTWGARLVHLGLLGICKKADFKDYHIFTKELKQEAGRRSRFDKKILQHLYEIESEFFEKAICDPQP